MSCAPKVVRLIYQTGEMITPSGEVRRVADVLLGRILTGAYPPGLRLPPENELAAEQSCGRSTIREALRYLADQGLVQSRRGSGALVRDWRRDGTPALLPLYVQLGRFDVEPAVLAAELLRIRTMMASEAVRLAALYAKPGSLDEAREFLRRAPALETDPAAHALNELELYRALVAASNLWPAAWVVNAIWGPLSELNRTIAPAFGPVPAKFQATMERLLELIAARQADAAVAHIQAWFRVVDAKLVRVIERLSAAVAPRPQPAATKLVSEGVES